MHLPFNFFGRGSFEKCDQRQWPHLGEKHFIKETLIKWVKFLWLLNLNAFSFQLFRSFERYSTRYWRKSLLTIFRTVDILKPLLIILRTWQCAACYLTNFVHGMDKHLGQRRVETGEQTNINRKLAWMMKEFWRRRSVWQKYQQL